MALSNADRARLESFVGRLEDDELRSVNERLERLVIVEAVALELVRTRLAEMRMSPAKLSAQGDVTVDHTANLAALEHAEAGLVNYLASGAVNLNTAATALLAEASGAHLGDYTSSIDVSAVARRRG